MDGTVGGSARRALACALAALNGAGGQRRLAGDARSSESGVDGPRGDASNLILDPDLDTTT